MNEALHPVETLEWCIYALFIQDETKIRKHCEMDFKERKTSLAISLGGYVGSKFFSRRKDTDKMPNRDTCPRN